MADISLSRSLLCRPCLQRLLRSSTRPFSTSSARRKHGPVSTFSPTSSPNLDTLLTTFRTNVFLPAHLLKLQQSLIYKPKNHHLITAIDEPATVKLGSEIHALKPLDRARDEPDTRKSLATMMELCKEPRDWRNIIPFVSELRIARRKITAWQYEKMVRRMGEQGWLGYILEMARRVEETGMRLGQVKIAREAMWAGVVRCSDCGWDEEGVGKASKYVESVWEMLSEERHVKGILNGKEGDPKIRPEIVGVVMWARALRSTLFEEKEDGEGKVKKAAEMVLAVWKNADLKVEEERWYDANMKLMMWTPVWHGMKMARKIVGENSPLGRDLTNTLTLDLEPAIQKAHDILSRHVPEDGSRRGLIMYDTLSKVAE